MIGRMKDWDTMAHTAEGGDTLLTEPRTSQNKYTRQRLHRETQNDVKKKTLEFFDAQVCNNVLVKRIGFENWTGEIRVAARVLSKDRRTKCERRVESDEKMRLDFF